MAKLGGGGVGPKGSSFLPSRPLWWGVGAMLLLGLLVTLVLTLVLAIPVTLGQTSPQVGQVSDRAILAPRKITYESQILTEEARRRAEMSVPDVYDPPDPRVTREQISRARKALETIDAIRRAADATRQERIAAVDAIADLSLPQSVVSKTLDMDQAAWRSVVTETLLVLGQAMRSPIREDNVDHARQLLPSMIDFSLSDDQAQVVAALAGSFIRANSPYNAEVTEASRSAARAAVEPEKRTIERGEAILREGDLVTPLDREALDALGFGQPSIEWNQVLGTWLLMAVFVAAMSLYLMRLHPDFWENERALALSALIVVVFAVTAKFIVPGYNLLPYLFPLAAASMLLTVLVGPRFALAGALLLSVLVGLMAGGSMELAIYYLVGSAVASVAVWRVERLAAFIWAGVYVALANLAVIAAFRLQAGSLDRLGVLQLAAMAVGNGALSASITVAGFFVLGNLFGITTTLQLMELARPTHPLLRQLQMKAPGTFHHSLIISNLAEQAAQRIGADALLVRVGAYYHDVGKAVRPYFFIENQLDRVNVHERLDPRTSAQIVIAHVTDGLELAKKHGLPQSIRNLIAQHHGTRLASFFYQQALKTAGDQPVNEADFRYPGPKPQSREAAIMMLADGIEAAVRASRPQSVGEIDEVVRKIINERLVEGDLDECDLTLRDLEQIRDVMVTALHGVYHPRLQYPEEFRLPQQRQATISSSSGTPPSANAHESEQPSGPVEKVVNLETGRLRRGP